MNRKVDIGLLREALDGAYFSDDEVRRVLEQLQGAQVRDLYALSGFSPASLVSLVGIAVGPAVAICKRFSSTQVLGLASTLLRSPLYQETSALRARVAELEERLSRRSGSRGLSQGLRRALGQRDAERCCICGAPLSAPRSGAASHVVKKRWFDGDNADGIDMPRGVLDLLGEQERYSPRASLLLCAEHHGDLQSGEVVVLDDRRTLVWCAAHRKPYDALLLPADLGQWPPAEVFGIHRQWAADTRSPPEHSYPSWHRPAAPSPELP
eukprot:m51a1_g10333 hypothetical protein (267) ;mRNA; f:103139-104215